MSDIYLYKNEMWRVKYDFQYTGEPQQFRLNSGRYLCICKGARGGGLGSPRNRGGSSYGILNLSEPLTAYAVVGGVGEDDTENEPTGTADPTRTNGEGGYNGGGRGGLSCNPELWKCGAGGGGGTDIRLSLTADEDTYEAHTMPSEYEQVEYLQGNGTPFINTGFTPSQNTDVEVVVQFHQSFSGWKSVYGSNYANVNKSYLMMIQSMNKTTFQRGTDKFHDDSYTFSLDTSYTIKTVGRKLIINNAEICELEDDPTFYGNGAICVFTSNQNGSTSGTIPMKLYSMKIWDNNKLQRYYVPYRNVGLDLGIGINDFDGNIPNCRFSTYRPRQYPSPQIDCSFRLDSFVWRSINFLGQRSNSFPIDTSSIGRCCRFVSFVGNELVRRAVEHY